MAKNHVDINFFDINIWTHIVYFYGFCTHSTNEYISAGLNLIKLSGTYLGT